MQYLFCNSVVGFLNMNSVDDVSVAVSGGRWDGLVRGSQMLSRHCI